MKKKYAFLAVDKLLFESDNINDILNKIIKYVFDGYRPRQMRVVENLPVTISGRVQIDNLGGNHSASSEIG